jgi:hypothetical protein
LLFDMRRWFVRRERVDALITASRSACGVAAVTSGLIAFAAIGLATVPAQTHPKTESVKAWRPPRTPDGHPDMQGVWTHGTATPFERPTTLGTKAFYTEAEAADVARQAATRRANPPAPRVGDVGGDNEAFVDGAYSYLRTRQTSIVVDPADGRLPFRPEAEKKREFNATSRDDYETMSPWDRCITRSPTLMLPAGYNNGIRIVQTPGFAMIEVEQIHEARIIPTDGRPHLDSTVTTWTGDPRGHWEGDTLVVDSANYTDRGWISTHAGSGRLRGTPNSTALHIVERFTMIDQNTIQYDMTVDDPSTFTQPWRASLLLNRSDDYRIYEYACAEGNVAIELVLRGARAEEKAATKNGGTP